MKRLSEITGMFVGKPFSECGCIDFVYRFYKECGVNVPGSIGAVTIENYMVLVHKNKKLAEATMIKVFKTIGTKVDFRDVRTGDLLVVMQPNKTMYPAVYLGDGGAMASFIRIGVSAFQLR